MARRPPLKLPPSDQMEKTIKRAIDEFRGQIPELESAIGMYYLGHALGWRVVYMIHSIATVRKYERILGIVAKEEFPENTPHSDRSLAYRVLEKVSNFWKAAKGVDRPDGFRNPELV